MEKEKVNWKKALLIGGSIIGFAIGSGFATGQEVLQFFASYGYWSLAGAAVFLTINLFFMNSLISTGYREQFEKGSDAFQYYCGPYIGRFFDYFTVIFIFMSYVIMIAGAAATFNEHFGLPLIVGGVGIAILACITVIFGLDAVVNLIGTIGPVKIFLAVCIALYGLFVNTNGISDGNALLPTLDVMKASSNWFLAAFSYVGFGLFWFVGFLTAIGKTLKNKKEGTYGVLIGLGVLTFAIAVMSLALLGNIKQVAGTQVPILFLAANIHPYFANIYAAVIAAGIYTAATPLLWTVSVRFAQEKTQKYKILTIVLAAVGCFIGLKVPFNILVHYLYVINGYIGIILLVFIAAKEIKNRQQKIKNKIIKNEESPTESV